MHQPLVPIAFPQRTSMPDGATLMAADVGGTKTILAAFDVRQGDLHLVRETRYPSNQHDSMATFIRHFKGDLPLPTRLSIAFAGPVQDGKAQATNLDWSIDTRQLSAELGIPDVFLINDLEAEAYGLAALTEKDMRTIYAGKTPPAGNAGIIAPGTGLGEGGLYWDGSALHPFATEGGHSDFAPRTPLDWELLQYLQQQYGHVSWERVLSGPGICHIFYFLRDIKKRQPADWVQAKMERQEPAAAIAEAAGEGCPVCAETLELFVRYLAEEASDLALKLKATGGIFLGGGIPPKIWNDRRQAIFLEHFFQVGRLGALLEAVPVHLVLNPKAVLLGAAWYGWA